MQTAADRIWHEFRDRLGQFIQKSVSNHQDAQDILQEVFLKIHNRLHTVRDQEKFTAWIYQITRNAMIDHFRRSKVRTEFLEQAGDIEQRRATFSLNDDIVACLKPMIQHLPDTYREALVLSDLKGTKQQQIAQILGLSLSGTKSRIQRARQKLKAILLECCHFQFDRYGNILDYKQKQEDCRYCAPNSTVE